MATTSPVPDDARTGVIVGGVAYTLWGLFPIYFKQLGEVAALDVLAWRIVLCAGLLLAAVILWKGAGALWQTVRSCRDWPMVLAATLVISINWLTFIFAVYDGEVLQSSLGYFLVPLVNSLLGMIVFGEKPNRWKRASLIVAAVGLSVSFAIVGVVPWYALVLALSFGLYGMLRKRMSLDSTTGLLLETLILSPLALGWLFFAGGAIDQLPIVTRNWLMLSGLITLIPLVLMVFAVKRIELGTLGILQYIAPLMHFVIAIGLYGETLNSALAAAFVTTLIAIACWLVGVRRGASVPSVAVR